MVIGALTLVTALAFPTLSTPAHAQSVGLPPLPEVDSRAAHQVERRLHLYYIFGGRTLHFSPYDGFCDADFGDFCFGGDWESSCRAFRCRSDEEMAEFVGELAKLAREHPRSPYAFGQAVYAAVRLDQPGVADSLTASCVDRVEWWCHMARGYVLHRGGRVRTILIISAKGWIRVRPNLKVSGIGSVPFRAEMGASTMAPLSPFIPFLLMSTTSVTRISVDRRVGHDDPAHARMTR